MIKLTPNMNFSHSISKGSAQTREKTAEKLNNQVFHEIISLYKSKKSCDISTIKTRYNLILPERKNINIKALSAKKYEEYGGSIIIEDNNSSLTGYTIEIPVSKSKKLNILDMPEFMHESTHIFDWLLNPKYVANYKKMREKNIFKKKYYQIYTNIYDNAEKILTKDLTVKKTKSAIKNIPLDEKITFLNYIKYRLELEKHAYKEEVRFAKLMHKHRMPVDSVSFIDFSKYMKIPEKIKIIKNIISEEISKERKSL